MAPQKKSKITNSKEFNTGCALWFKGKYSEAEEVFKQAVYIQERTLGEDHKDTLNSKYWLGCTLHDQKKYSEAEALLQHVVYQQGRTLGEEHKDTLESKYWLGCILNGQEKYSDAEELFKIVIEGQGRTLGEEHADTFASKYQLGCVLYNQKRYSEAEQLFQEVAQRWENELGLGHEDTLATIRLLQECQLKSGQSHPDFVERFGWQVGAEKFLWGEEPAEASTLTKRRSLGEGQFGKVEEVITQGSNESMARKEFFIYNCGSKWATARIRSIKGEIASLRRLSHPHIVTIIGCYQEEETRKNVSVYVLMQPVGDNDLRAFMETEYTGIDERLKWIKKWFVCLASALAYMHVKGVHHEDIKPENILHRGDHVFFADFGSSRRLEAGDQTSTTSVAMATRRFAAPEAFRSDDNESPRHGSKTDVFSLGLVFVELFVVLIGGRIETLRNHVFSDYKSSIQEYHRVSHKFNSFFSNNIESNSDDSALQIYHECFEDMLRKERKDRPSAKDVLNNMRKTKVFESGLRCECAQGNMEMENSDSNSEEGCLDLGNS
jgi:serine/threonine protein kinase